MMTSWPSYRNQNVRILRGMPMYNVRALSSQTSSLHNTSPSSSALTAKESASRLTQPPPCPSPSRRNPSPCARSLQPTSPLENSTKQRSSKSRLRRMVQFEMQLPW
eukprot:PhF_6_TR36290/c0_g1_i2/m.52928